MVMKALVTGDREWNDIETVLRVLQQLPPNTTIVHGACRGADVTCAAGDEAIGLPIQAYPADWTGRGRAAGPIRNQQMLDYCEHRLDELIDVCLAFHNDIDSSKGTRDMGDRAQGARIRVRLFTSKGEVPWPVKKKRKR